MISNVVTAMALTLKGIETIETVEIKMKNGPKRGDERVRPFGDLISLEEARAIIDRNVFRLERTEASVSMKHSVAYRLRISPRVLTLRLSTGPAWTATPLKPRILLAQLQINQNI